MHVPSGWCLYIDFTYRDVPDPLKMFRGKGCAKTFVEHIEDEVKHIEDEVKHIEDEVKRLYATFSQQPATELMDVLKRKHEAAENIFF